MDAAIAAVSGAVALASGTVAVASGTVAAVASGTVAVAPGAVARSMSAMSTNGVATITAMSACGEAVAVALVSDTEVSLMTVVLVVTSVGVDMVTIAIEASADTTLAVVTTETVATMGTETRSTPSFGSGDR
jgi:hypothetical protein